MEKNIQCFCLDIYEDALYVGMPWETKDKRGGYRYNGQSSIGLEETAPE
ncbi:MAG: hypothetical protein J7J85_06295 [Deltaproteobacteria bacterium]|nr:hypothetical protein [Deltaproteobacteria bacterium]